MYAKVVFGLDFSHFHLSILYKSWDLKHTHTSISPVSNASSPCCSSSVPNPRDGAGHTPRSSGETGEDVFWVDLLTPWWFSQKKWTHQKKTHCFLIIDLVCSPFLAPSQKNSGYTYVKNTTCKTLTKLARNTPSCCTFVSETLLTAGKKSMQKKEKGFPQAQISSI